MNMNKSLQLVTAGLPIGSLEAYIDKVNQVPMLTEEEERELTLSYANEGNLEAAQRLVLSHLRFVVRIARAYLGYGLPLGDLIQEGNMGLMKAVKRFDPKVGVRLVTFAVHWIKAEIQEFILRNWRIVKVATTKAQRKLFFNLRKAKQRLGWFNREEIAAVADDLGVTEAQVEEMEMRMAAHDIGFDISDEEDSDHHEIIAPVLYLEDKRSDPARQLEKEDTSNSGLERLQEALMVLDDRSQHIVTKRWLAEPKATLQELADHYQVSAERIRQLEQLAMKKLRTAMEAS